MTQRHIVAQRPQATPLFPEPQKVRRRSKKDPHDSSSRLIESYFPSAVLSREGKSERYQRGKTPHTIFTWWARRPFAAMRGVVATSLTVTNKASHATQSTIEAYCAATDSLAVLTQVKRIVKPMEQRVLDMFSGGATIPLEAAAIGSEVYALDNNELAHFIGITLLQFSQVRAQLPELVETHGKALLARLKNETAMFFPFRAGSETQRTIAYFWSRSLHCPSCRASLSLQKRPWMSRKKGKAVFLERIPDADLKRYTKRLATNGEPNANASAWDKAVITCPFCNFTISREDMDNTFSTYGYDELTSYCQSSGYGKQYQVCNEPTQFVPDEDWLKGQIAADLALLGGRLPEIELPRWSGITNPTLYGIHKIADLFNTRQLAILVRCCRLLHEEYEQCALAYGAEVGKAIVAFLSGFLDQLVDWNCRICMWIAQNEQVGRGLSGPGIPMMWDFVEIDPVEYGPANLWDKLDRILSALQKMPQFERLPNIMKGDARDLPFPDGYFDAVVTDPPYFDNLYYSILANCIYVWKRLAFSDIFPDMFAPESTNDTRELTVSKYRHGSQKAATGYYTDGMTAALSEARRVLKPSGVLSFVFTHSSIDGWASVIEAFQSADLRMTNAWELHVERKHRPRSVQSHAIDVSFVLVGRKVQHAPVIAVWADLHARLVQRLREENARLSSTDRTKEDIGLSLFGIAACVCAQTNRATDGGTLISIYEMLDRAAQEIEVLVPGFTMARR